MQSVKPLITNEDFDSWRGNAVTQAVFAHLESKIAEAERIWLAQLMSERAMDAMALLLWKTEVKAKIEIIQDLIGLQLEDIASDADGSVGEAQAKKKRLGKS